ncbi:isoaspartyl peptidase/L-asparaginase [Psychromonas sp. RZ22]|uniref:isoaspartyl peptidase/L-asparaginase family protein n=1 Tax=Psychromonas algarum TaxID=2555643 RepID=UPI00106868E8|nr:isoaspartyl peptidase/L-asparaginase [Psychromonas sp. RZ22]TEW54312.1 isoaspartyl peptidase/L-asparaginase [Psychromonas sp. RZ22]
MTYALAIHGGAGTIDKSKMSPQLEKEYIKGLEDAIYAGEKILKNNGSAIDAVCAAVCVLEDHPLFNAGRGAVFTSNGTHEMDAALMDGKDQNVGAVAGAFGPKNPILLARKVMEETDHAFIIGDTLNDIANSHNLVIKPKEYFFTQQRWDALQETLKLKQEGKVSDDPAVRHGTVGAVALDEKGNVAAATSTGGMTGKLPGRVGDSPVIGGGTFASNQTCAVSATGYGEIFMRYTAAADVSSRMKFLNEDVQTAATHIVMEELLPNDGTGGLIAVDIYGNISMPFNSSGMYRASVSSKSDLVVAIF